MSTKTRSQYSILNVFSGVFGQVLTMLLGFVTRTVFIYTLGKSYLGISGLFQNVLQILSITDLGLESAIVFSLYKPLAEKDEMKIASIMALYKKAYRVIGLIVFCVGLCLMPALPFLIKGKTDLIDVHLVFLLYLFQTCSSYLFFAYCRTIYVADQHGYKTSVIGAMMRVVASVAEIIVLVVFHNFYVYLIIGISTTILTNIVIRIFAQRDYPCIKKKEVEKLPKEELSTIKKNVVGSSFYKICGVVTNSTDNLLISAMVGVDMVGIYSNYLLFTNYIQIFLNLVFNGVTASVGNLYVTESQEKNETVFNRLTFLNFWLYGFCGIALFCLINPFICIWLGDTSYLLPTQTVFIIFFYLVLVGLQYSLKSYRSACGLFWKGKFRPIATVVINLGVSIALGSFMGLDGILIGTIASHVLTLFWYDPILIYREVFHKSSKGYFFRYLANLIGVVVVGCGLYYLLSFLPYTIPFFILRILVVVAVPNGLIALIYCRSDSFKYVMNSFVKPLLRRVLKKLKIKRST